MSVPLGGFGFTLGFSTQQADAALQAFIQNVRQGSAQVQAAFDQIRGPRFGTEAGGQNPFENQVQAQIAATQRATQQSEQIRARSRAKQAQDEEADYARAEAAGVRAEERAFAAREAARARTRVQVQQADAQNEARAAAEAARGIEATERSRAAARVAAQRQAASEQAKLEADYLKAEEAGRRAEAASFQKMLDDEKRARETAAKDADAARAREERSAVAHNQRLADNAVKAHEAALREKAAADRRDQARLEREAERQQRKIDAENARPSQAQQVASGLQRGAFQGLLAAAPGGDNLLIGLSQGLTAATAAAAIARIAVEQLVQGIGQAIQSSIQYNAVLQTQVATFRQFTGSAAAGRQAMREIRELAAQSPFADEQEIAAGAGFLRISQGDLTRTKELLQLTEALAAAHPELGFEAMQAAMNQLISGDFRAFEDRTNIAFGSVRRLAEQGKSGMDLYRGAVQLAGGSTELLAKNQQAFTAQLTTLQSTIAGINAAFGRGLFDQLTRGLQASNSLLSAHRQGWEDVAERVGRQLAQAPEVAAMFTSWGAAAQGAGQILEWLAERFDTVAKKNEELRQRREENAPTPVTPSFVVQDSPERLREIAQARAERMRQQQALTPQIEQTTAALSLEKSKLDDINRELKITSATAAEVNAVYAAALIPLQAQIELLERPTQIMRARQALLLANERFAAEIAQRQEAAQGAPRDRADLAGERVEIEHAQELLQIAHRRQELEEAIQNRTIEAQRRIRQNALDAQAEALAGHREEIRVAQEGRQANLETLREQTRGQQEVRQAALERLREEARANQEVRQAALDRLRDEVKANQEARRDALDRLRDEIRANAEARQADLDGLRDVMRARQEARQVALDATREIIRAHEEERRVALDSLREQIRDRRDAYQQARDTARELADAAERQYQRDADAADRANRREQDRYRRQIDQLRERDRQANQQAQGPSAAERELDALEQANRERERAQALTEATLNVSEARSSREWRDARRRLEALREQQAYERNREALQLQIDQEKERREQQSQQRQEQIRQLEQKAQDADRAYREEKDARDLAHQQQRDALEAANREEDRAEKQRQREEDAQVRNQERADREAAAQEQRTLREQEQAAKAAEREEANAIRAAERAAREEERADADRVRAAEREAHDADQADAARVREAERVARDADRAAQAAIRQQEREDRELKRQEDAAIRQQEREDRELKRQEDAILRQEEREYAEAQRRERERVRKEEDEQNERQLVRIREARELEIKALENRQKVLQLQDVAALAQAARDAVISQHIAATLGNAQKIDEITQRLVTLNLRFQVEDLIAGQNARIAEIEARRAVLAGSAARMEVQVAILEQKLKDLQRQQTELSQPGEAERPLQGPALPNQGFVSTATGWASDLISGFVNAINADGRAKQAITDWSNEDIVDPAAEILGVKSPSTVSRDWAFYLAEGFIQQLAYQAAFIQEAMRSAFTFAPPTDATGEATPGTLLAYQLAADFINQIAFQREFTQAAIAAAFAPPTLEGDPGAGYAFSIADGFIKQLVYQQQFTQAALKDAFTLPPLVGDPGADRAFEIANGFIVQMGFQSPFMQAALREPFDTFATVTFPTVLPQFESMGRQAAVAWSTGFNLGELANGAIRGMNGVIGALGQYANSFTVSGSNAAQWFQNGWTTSMARWQPYVPQAAAGGGGGGGEGSQPGRNSGGSSGGSQPAPAPVRPPTRSPQSQADCPPGTYFDEATRTCSVQPPSRPPAGAPIAWSIGTDPGFTPTPTGPVTPPSYGISPIVAAAQSSARSVQPVVAAPNGPITLNLKQEIHTDGITDPNTFAQKVTDQAVAAIIDVLDVTQQQAGTPVSRVLPGAV